MISKEEKLLNSISNTNIENFSVISSVEKLRKEVPPNEKVISSILKGRELLQERLRGRNQQFLVIVGPCSIHDYQIAIDYAKKIQGLQEKFQDKLMLIMRVYFEKPRTTTGWKGFINDPDLNDTFKIDKGLKLARKLLIDIANLGVYTATEVLGPVVSAYIAELVTWIAIGARTTESQIHRELVSGLSAPVGFKNGTNGDLMVAINAMKSASSPHNFVGVDSSGSTSLVETKGNPFTHIVLRGGNGSPNYSREKIAKTESLLKEAGFIPQILVDCSHDNSGKNHEKQSEVIKDIISQKQENNQSIIGVMLESNLFSGNQKLVDKEKLKFGVSITDKCIGWEETEMILNKLYKSL